jgi:dTDP-4-amino-4,6-dideoxy-D-galactose acyltransferase
MKPDPCTELPWDSTFFGRRIARVAGHRSSDAHANEVLTWCASHHIDCVYFLADADDRETVRAVTRRGFELVDIRVTLVRTGAVPTAGAGIRPCLPADVRALEAIARSNHTDTRFYFDGRFPRERCDDLYATWIASSCAGRADAVLVAERDGAPAGYISCHVDRTRPDRVPVGSIGLLGVAESSQGHGIGGALIDSALAWFGEHGLATVEVVTQGRNVRAQRAYQRRGFVTQATQLWFHRWFSDDSGAGVDDARSRTA